MSKITLTKRKAQLQMWGSVLIIAPIPSLFIILIPFIPTMTLKIDSMRTFMGNLAGIFLSLAGILSILGVLFGIPIGAFLLYKAREIQT